MPPGAVAQPASSQVAGAQRAPASNTPSQAASSQGGTSSQRAPQGAASQGAASQSAPSQSAPSQSAPPSFAQRFQAQKSGTPLPPRPPAPSVQSADPEVRLVNRVLPGDVKLFAPENSPEGCASGECIPDTSAPASVAPVAPPSVELHEADEPEPPPPVAASNRTVGTDAEKWRRAVEGVRQASPRHGKSLSYARFLGFTPEGVKVAFPPDAAFHRSQVIGMSRAIVETELARALGRPIKLVEDTDAATVQAAPKSIAEIEASDRNTRERSIEEKVRSHPALRSVLRHLGGALEHIAYLEPATRPAGGPVTAGPADEGDAGPPVD